MNFFLMALVTSLMFYSFILRKQKDEVVKRLDGLLYAESINALTIDSLKLKTLKQLSDCKERNETLVRLMWKNHKKNAWYLKTVREIRKRNSEKKTSYGIGGLGK